MNFTWVGRAVLLLGALVVCAVVLIGALGAGGTTADASTPVPTPASSPVPGGRTPAVRVRVPRPAATTPGGGLLGGVASIGSSKGSLELGVLPGLGGGPLIVLRLPGLGVTVGKTGTTTAPGRPRSSPPAGGRTTHPAASEPATGPRSSSRAPGRSAPGAGSGAPHGVGAVGDGPTGRTGAGSRRPQPSAPVSSAQALPPPGPSVYRTLRQSFPYLAAVACAAAVLVFGFVLMVAVLARRRDPLAAIAPPVRAERRRPRPRPRPAHWDYTFDASNADEQAAGPVGTRHGRRPFTRRP